MTKQNAFKPSKVNILLRLGGWIIDIAVVIFMIYRQFEPLVGSAAWKFPGILHLVATFTFVVVHNRVRHTSWLQVWKPAQRKPINIWVIFAFLLIIVSGLVAVNHNEPLDFYSTQSLTALGMLFLGIIILICQE